MHSPPEILFGPRSILLRTAQNRTAYRLSALMLALVAPGVRPYIIEFAWVSGRTGRYATGSACNSNELMSAAFGDSGPPSLPKPFVTAARSLVLLAAVAVASSSPRIALGQVAPPRYAAVTLTPAQARADLALLRRALQEVHAGYDRYTPRHALDTAFARLLRRAAEPISDLAFYGDVALLLAQIRCNHTKAEYPAALQTFRGTAATHLPVHVRIFDRRLFVALSQDTSIARGSEITTINGVRAVDIITRLARYAAVDGYTDFARTTLLEADADLMGSDLDHYWPIEFGFATAFTFGVKTATGSARTVTLAPITFAAWKALSGRPQPDEFGRNTRWAMLDDTTAQLTIRSFVNYRTPVNADSLYRSIFTDMRSRHVRHLVLDLRGNGGGSDDASEGLLRYLIDAPVRAKRSVRRRTIRVDSALAAAFDTWGDRAPIFTPAAVLFDARSDGWFAEKGAAEILQPAAGAFRGRVSVLVDRSNSSATTMLLAVLQQVGAHTGRLRLIGEETGGSAEGVTAGQILFLKLLNSGLRVRIPLKRSDVNVAAFIPGLGVLPDVDATETLADFRAGIDRALVTARSTPWRVAASPLAPTIGLMRGVLEYRDYQGGSRVLLPTWVHTSPIGTTGAFRVRTVYDDGPGNTIYSPDVVRVVGDRWIEGSGGEDGATTEAQTTLRITSRRRVPEGERLLLRNRGMDDDKAVEFRYTVIVGRNVSRRLKEFRLPGTPWEYRHEYRLSRTNAAR